MAKPKHDDRDIDIAVIKRGQRGRAKNVTWTWAKFRERAFDPEQDKSHTLPQYLRLSIDEQNKLKDVGSFVGGHFREGKRKRANLIARSILTLDVDQATEKQKDRLLDGTSGIAGYEYIVISTRKHEADKPRLRIVILMNRDVSVEEYGPLARIVASKLFKSVEASMDAVDDVSYRAPQIMYWPSVCKNAEFIAHHNTGKLLDPDDVLEDFGDWQDWSLLPHSEKRGVVRPTGSKKAEDPTLKVGWVGAFCRTYDVPAAIEKYLPEIYTPGDDHSSKPRYTYLLGSSSNGFIIEDDGAFGYSHHGTDPVAERLVNSFDLVRTHLFGAEDTGTNTDDLSPTKWPSFKAMVEFIENDPEVLAAFNPDLEEAFQDLGDEESAIEPTEHEAEVDTLLGPPPKKKKTPLDLMNGKHAIARQAGRTVILTFERDGHVEFGSLADLNLYYANNRVPTAKTSEPLSAWWIRQPDRRTYPGGVAFMPGRTRKGLYNLWQGFSVEPDPDASCKYFLDHLRVIVCKNRKAEYDYLIGWMAHMIQHPEEKPGVAVAMKGVKGAGKDTVGDYLAELFKRHRIKVSQMEHLTGKFNAHQAAALLIHVEEGIWAGDKSAVGPLNSVITSPTIRIEKKGLDTFELDSYCRVIITTNERWAVPATKGERRYAVYEVSGDKAKNTKYFAKIAEEKEGSGPAALLHFLMHYDLTGFDVRNPPETEGLANQKMAGLKGVEKFWYDVLAEGDLPSSDGDYLFPDLENHGDEEPAAGWRETWKRVWSGELYAAYEAWHKKHRHQGEIESSDIVGRMISIMCPSRTRKRKAVGSRGTRREYFYSFPPVRRAREEFATWLESEIEWGDEEENEIDDLLG